MNPMARSHLSHGLILSLSLLSSFPRSSARDEPTYDLRGPASSVGQVLRGKMKLKIQDAETTLKIAGEKPIEMKVTMDLVNETEHKILTVDGRKITKCQSKIIQDRSDTTIEGSAKPETIRHVLEGEIVISERVGESKWKNSLVDTVLTEKLKKELEDYIGFESGDELYPEEKIPLGHTWNCKAKSLTKLFNNSFTEINGELKQKFVKLETFGGEECAVVESSGTVKCKMKDEEGAANTDVETQLKAIFWRSLKSGVDLKEAIDGKIKFSGPQKVGGDTVQVSLSGPIKGECITTIKQLSKP